VTHFLRNNYAFAVCSEDAENLLFFPKTQAA
jgi:hypothetical protein